MKTTLTNGFEVVSIYDHNGKEGIVLALAPSGTQYATWQWYKTIDNTYHGHYSDSLEGARVDMLHRITDAMHLESQVSIVWSLDDVKCVRPKLTYDQAYDVLCFAKRKHDCEVGINWDVLRTHADFLFPESEEVTDDA